MFAKDEWTTVKQIFHKVVGVDGKFEWVKLDMSFVSMAEMVP